MKATMIFSKMLVLAVACATLQAQPQTEFLFTNVAVPSASLTQTVVVPSAGNGEKLTASFTLEEWGENRWKSIIVPEWVGYSFVNVEFSWFNRTVKFTVPEKDGVYRLTVKWVDKEGEQKQIEKFWFPNGLKPFGDEDKFERVRSLIVPLSAAVFSPELGSKIQFGINALVGGAKHTFYNGEGEELGSWSSAPTVECTIVGLTAYDSARRKLNTDSPVLVSVVRDGIALDQVAYVPYATVSKTICE